MSVLTDARTMLWYVGLLEILKLVIEMLTLPSTHLGKVSIYLMSISKLRITHGVEFESI